MTQTYKVELDIGPLATILGPSESPAATTGERIVWTPGEQAPTIAMTDPSHPVNRYVSLHIWQSASGALDLNTAPVVTATDDNTGAIYPLQGLRQMYAVQIGQSDAHFGANVYLPNDTYDVTVTIGNESTTFIQDALTIHSITLRPPEATPVATLGAGS